MISMSKTDPKNTTDNLSDVNLNSLMQATMVDMLMMSVTIQFWPSSQYSVIIRAAVSSAMMSRGLKYLRIFLLFIGLHRAMKIS